MTLKVTINEFIKLKKNDFSTEVDEILHSDAKHFHDVTFTLKIWPRLNKSLSHTT